MKEVISQVIHAEEEAEKIKKQAQAEAAQIIQDASARGRQAISKAKEASLAWGRDEIARIEHEISLEREQRIAALRTQFADGQQNIDEIVDRVVTLIGEGR